MYRAFVFLIVPFLPSIKAFFPRGCGGASFLLTVSKTHIAVDSIVLPRTHFVGNSLGSFSLYINPYMFTLDLLGFSILPKFQKYFPRMHINSTFSTGRNFVCHLFVSKIAASL